MGVEGKVVLVTGASRGIGRACALTLARHGAKVIAAARSEDRLEALAHEAQGECTPVRCDVAHPESVDALFAAIAERHGRLDVAFNNAGIMLPTVEFGDLAPADWRQ